jgi:cullin 3
MPGSGLVTMVDHDRTTDLNLLYTLFSRVPNQAGKEALRNAIHADVEERGKAINDSANQMEPGPSANGDQGTMEVEGDPKGKGKVKPTTSASAALTSALRWVQDVLDLKDKYDKILSRAFGDDKTVQTSINHVSVRQKCGRQRLTGRHFNLSSMPILAHPNSYHCTSTSTSRRVLKPYVSQNPSCGKN